jgi:hypothetical protein
MKEDVVVYYFQHTKESSKDVAEEHYIKITDDPKKNYYIVETFESQ